MRSSGLSQDCMGAQPLTAVFKRHRAKPSTKLLHVRVTVTSSISTEQAHHVTLTLASPTPLERGSLIWLVWACAVTKTKRLLLARAKAFDFHAAPAG